MSPTTPLHSTADDAALLSRLRSGDDAAYSEWVRRESPRLLAVTRRMLRDEDEAQDAVQEAFLSAWRALPSFGGFASLSTWLHRIGVNAALMRLRSRRRRREESIDDRLPGFADDGHHETPVEPWSRSATNASEQREIRDVVRACIERLPENYRSVLLLRDIEGLDTAEAARALGTSPEALKMRLHRARQALRAELAPYMSANAVAERPRESERASQASPLETSPQRARPLAARRARAPSSLASAPA